MEQGKLNLTDQDYMRLAIELAKKGAGYTSPNPLVGAVLVKDGRVIGRGYHAHYGELHAERAALLDCKNYGENPEGAVMYVTLEPCGHDGQQPPGALNPIYFHYITKKLPYVAVKYAMTFDGKIATASGASKWITGEAARKRVHYLRSRYSAIITGVGTVLADNPLLTAHGEGKNPVRIVVDTHAKTPLESNLVKTAREVQTIIATCEAAGEKLEALKAAGCKVWTIAEKGGMVDLRELLVKLAGEKIDSVFVEAGGSLVYSFFETECVQKVYAFIAPKVFGGAEAKTPVEGKGIHNIADAYEFKNCNAEKIGEDVLLEADVIAAKTQEDLCLQA